MPPERLGMQSWVVVHEAAGWVAAAYQNARINDAGPPRPRTGPDD